MDYSKTVNLLQTPFPMKADLPVREPLLLKKWEAAGLYEKIQKKGEKKPVLLLHDGPPYANGDIHMGHALNKVLKDFVVKYKTMAGFRSPYKPGWDCHGLPIEHQLFKKLGKSKHEVPRSELRKKATEYALEFVDRQKADFKRLGIFGEWENPYLTLNKDYEAGIVETFFELQEKGFIYRGLKPGYWCAYDETALAEAEVEYADKKSDSVYVRFKINKETLSKSVRDQIDTDGTKLDLYVLIWTTTPWTLPANKGLAFHPDESYVCLAWNSSKYIVAEKRYTDIQQIMGSESQPCLISERVKLRGKEFLSATAINPLNRQESRLVNARYVTMDDGTGIVHIAPGHGVEDFSVGQEHKLDVVSPVDERGRFDNLVGIDELVGKHVLKDANAAVIDILKRNKDLISHNDKYKHSYPHCWRCKNPIIFRATEQWFLRVSDEFRSKLLAEIDKVQWEPSYGIHRIKGMVQQRPDWCLSRQRLWGAPIAVFYCKKCRTPLHDKEVNKRIIALIRQKGGDGWYETPTDDFLKGTSASCPSCKGSAFDKEMDILDVWFDSGVSWHAVVEAVFADPKPQTIMYLEGSDQHRGWFQTSLIPSVALRNKAPYDVVLTHGFVVDGNGHKMSKSLGNVIVPQEIIQKYGADILRLWVAASDYREDVRLSMEIIKHVVDIYRRFRNTFRFLLQNTSDFKRPQHGVPFEKMGEIDQWILTHFEDIKGRVIKAYDAYEFHVVLSELNQFVSVTLSGFYLDALKDWLYCDAPNSPRRRSTQTALFHLMRGLAVLLAPLLSFTSEEAYLDLRQASSPDLPESVFLDDLGSLLNVTYKKELNEKWLKILGIRTLVNEVLDKERKSGVIRSSQEAAVSINPAFLEPAYQELLQDQKEDWPFILQMAEVHIINGKNGSAPAVAIHPSKFAKCERCWRHRPDVGRNAVHPTLCSRCADVVSLPA